MQPINIKNIAVDNFSSSSFQEKGIQTDVLRLDKIHPIVSGNKWFKLRFYLEEAIQQNKKRIVTFGGAWSNHIVATAAACKINNINCKGIIRGEEPSTLSPTLLQAKELGMDLAFTSRSEYAEKVIPPHLSASENYIINEGGYGEKGATGAATILDSCKKERYTHICCAAGTGTMAAGLANTIGEDQQLIVTSALKNNTALLSDITKLSGSKKNIAVIDDYHFGGYAKHKPSLLNFMNDFFQQTGIPTDFVYTGKLLYALSDLAKQDFFPPESCLLIIHSGGLQGNASLSNGTLIF